MFEDVLIERGAAITRVELDEGEPLPDWRDFDLIVAMGGPMSVNDESEHPWLVAEKRLIREAVQRRRRLLGRLPGRAAAGLQPGRARLRRAAARGRRAGGDADRRGRVDPVFAGLPRELPTLQWHGDTFDLPEGAVRCWPASPAYPQPGLPLRPGRLRRAVPP